MDFNQGFELACPLLKRRRLPNICMPRKLQQDGGTARGQQLEVASIH